MVLLINSSIRIKKASFPAKNVKGVLHKKIVKKITLLKIDEKVDSDDILSNMFDCKLP